MIESNTPLLGRCKSCDFVLFSTQVESARDWNDIRQIGLAYQFVGPNGVIDAPRSGFFARCPNGHKAFTLKPVEGTYSPDHKCDSRCLNAKGHTCTCSCGGANHGRGYAVEVTQIDHEPGFIGEVGEHIRGTARIVGVRENIGQYDNTLLTFLTQKGDTIKWFAPKNIGQPYIERKNQDITFRAKVKQHADDRFGKATIVTYFEEVE